MYFFVATAIGLALGSLVGDMVRAIQDGNVGMALWRILLVAILAIANYIHVISGGNYNNG